MRQQFVVLSILVILLFFSGCTKRQATDNYGLNLTDYTNETRQEVNVPNESESEVELVNNTSGSYRLLQNLSGHPWPMFHGNYGHSGYADVSGPANATVKWKFYLGNSQGNSPNSIAISKDKMILVAGAGKVFALNDNGVLNWSREYRNAQGPAIAEDDSIYFVSEDSVISLYANGSERWQFKTYGKTIFGPTVGPDGIVYQGSWDGYFYAINSNGKLKWKYKTKGAVSYPASIDRNGVVYVGGGDAHSGPDGNVYSLDQDGDLRWTFDTKSLRAGSPAIGFDGLIYVPAAPTLYVLDSGGNLNKKIGPSAGVKEISGIITPAIASDGTIYVGNSQGVLLAIDALGKIKWSFMTGPDRIQANFYGIPSFLVVDNESTVYAGSVDGVMYAVDRNGKLKWKYQTGNKITEAAPALGPDGTLYFTSEDGYLYAIGN